MRYRRILQLMAVISALLISHPSAQAEGGEKGDGTMAIKLTSPAFKDGEMIPEKHGYHNDNISVPLEWSGIPQNAKSIAAICDDPDSPSGTWAHLVLFNIPPAATGLPENLPRSETLEDGAIEGTNDFKNIGYDGPCPPSGIHRYSFRVYALDKMLDINPGANRQELLDAIKGHILAEGRLTGRYSK